ncbi:hypothetical protein RF11_00063 [Thelohanellus kitauei]|nr:hypothetical protein RF11_00063 [Thelohanellus kitauei]
MFIIDINKSEYHGALISVSYVWVVIINGPRNTFQINTIDKLVLIATIFAIDLSLNLLNVFYGVGPLKENKNTKQMLYIIYLTLVAFPIIDHSAYPWLRSVLIKLHHSVQKYINTEFLRYFSFNNQFLFAQYFLKSQAILKIRISKKDAKKLDWFFGTLATQQPLSNIYLLIGIHSAYLATHLNLDIAEPCKMSTWPLLVFFTDIKNILKDLITALSDETYITKLETEQKLFMYEDLKSQYLSIINEDLIQNVFSECEYQLRSHFDNLSPEIFENNCYNIYKNLMARTIHSLNESNYLDKNRAGSFMKVYHVNTGKFSQIPVDHATSVVTDDFKVMSTTLIQANANSPLRINALLKWFILIYEIKFIFGDIKSKFDNLNFI